MHSLFLLLALLAGPAQRDQLGPADGRELPPADLERVKAGSVAPDFALEDVEGRRVALSSFRSKRKVVLVFYRGYW